MLCAAPQSVRSNSGCKWERLFMCGRTVGSSTSPKNRGPQKNRSQSALAGRAGDSEDETFAAVKVCPGSGADAANLLYGSL